MPNILKVFSQQNTPMPTPKSSCTINQSATESEEVRTSFSPIIRASAASVKQSYTQTESSTKVVGKGHRKVVEGPTKEGLQRKMSVGGSTVKTVVNSPKTSATTGIPARSVEKGEMGKRPAHQRGISEVTNGMRLRYLRYNIWDPDSDFSPNTADWTLTAKPLEGPPQSVMDDE